MKKSVALYSIVLMVVALGLGCSVPQEEAVTLEPEEAIVTAESGNVEAASENEDETVSADNVFPSFVLKNLNDEEVTEALFTEHDLTLVNIWGTTCAPCVREMPELEKLQENYADKGLKVVGIVADGNHLAASEITKAILVTYEHLIPTEEFVKDYLNQFQFVPTTLFIDKQGHILGEPMVGAFDYETFEEKVKEHLGID